jgi:hypothetical protein
LAIRALAPPEVLPADAPAAEFSAVRAAFLLKPIAAEPHPMGVPAHDWVRDTILRDWRALGLEPVVQTGVRFRPAGWEATRVENILVRLPGTAGRALMLSTHYDSVEPAPGAADDGAGVVTLLETARALLAGPRLAQDIIFLITDGEEDGLVGAQVFCAQHPWAKEVGLALNFEARGTAGSSLMYQTSRGNRELIAALARSPHPRGYSFAGTVYRHMPNAGDLTVFMRSGMQGLVSPLSSGPTIIIRRMTGRPTSTSGVSSTTARMRWPWRDGLARMASRGRPARTRSISASSATCSFIIRPGRRSFWQR